MTDTASTALARSGIPRDETGLGIAQVMLAALLWGTVGVATRLVGSSGALPQEVLGLARMAVGGPALLVLVLVIARGSWSGLRLLSPGWLLAFALGAAVFQIGLFQCFMTLGVTATVFLTVCIPPLIGTLVSAMLGRQALRAGALVALIIAVVGLLVFAAGGIAVGDGTAAVRGLLTAVVASAAFVLMTSAARRMTLVAGPLLVAGTGLSASALILLAILPLVETAPAMPLTLDWQLAALVIYLGVGPTAIAYVLYCSGMARCRSANVGLVASMIEPAFAAMLAWLLLHESLTFAQFTGCALVMLAMIVLWAAERRQGSLVAVD